MKHLTSPVAPTRSVLASKNAKKAFTLIELLVVIAIIAILAAILFPVFARARENARRSSCTSNLKQIALGMIQYSQDYDEKYPLAVSGNNINFPIGWVDATQPYLKSFQIFQCPSESDVATPQNSDAAAAGYSDYWMNAALSWNQSTTAPSYKVGLSQAALSSSSLTIMVGGGSSSASNGRYRANGCSVSTGSTSADPGFGGCSTTGLATVVGMGSSTASPRPHVIHLDGNNYAFADGHVKWYKGNVAATAGGDVASSVIYNITTPMNVSQNNPTFAIN